MSEAQIIGYLVLGIITLGSFFGVVAKFTKPIKDIEDKFTKSINDLTLVIQELKIAINSLKESNNLVNKRLEKHGIEIDNLDRRVHDLETKMTMYHDGKE